MEPDNIGEVNLNVVQNVLQVPINLENVVDDERYDVRDIDEGGDDSDHIYDDGDISYDEDDNNEGAGDVIRDEEEIFKSTLARIVIKYKFSRDATNEILRFLKENGHAFLPITRETLLHTPKIPILVRKIGDAEYFHVGLQKALHRCNYEFLIHQDVIEIDVNIDGLSLSKSSKLKTWPILGAFPNKPNISPFIIGAFVGYSNPPCIDDFLLEFVNEARNSLANGVEVTPQRIRKPMSIRAYICYAPARAFLTGTKSHVANIGCNKCDQRCVNINGKKTFLTTSGNIRTDESFRYRIQQEHHQLLYVTRPTLLETLGTQVPNDPMHLVDEGVFARMLGSLFFGPCAGVGLSNIDKQRIDEIYISYAPYVPSEFSRKTRSIINEFSRWKGTEFRFWGLYGGFVVLKDFVEPVIYKHFLDFFTAIRLLSCPSTCGAFTDCSENLLKAFVENYGR